MLSVENKAFIELITHYNGSEPEEAKSILDLRKTYPYSQVIQVLAARFAKDHAWDNQQSLLQSAAVYSTDRSVLKEVMTRTYAIPVTLSTGQPAVVHETPVVDFDSSVDFADEIMKDLKQLRKSKHDFETMLSGLDSVPSEEAIPKKRGPGRPRKKKVDDEPADPLIEEIKTTKKKIAPAKKTKEQIEIIDNFIKAQPSITPKKSQAESRPAEENKDLSNDDFGDNVVSETLVEILRKQGKKDKAIEVLKKLIWKFPQKKAYFAAQIEELKK